MSDELLSYKDMRLAKIIGYDGYFISDTGFCYSNKSGELKRLSHVVMKTGYRDIVIRGSVNKSKKHFKIHRLVATYFCKRKPGFDVVNHKNGDKSNNHYSNLEWCTDKMNRIHAAYNKLTSHGERHPKAKITEKQALEIKKSNETCEVLSVKYGISPCSISAIKSKRTWRHLPNE